MKIIYKVFQIALLLILSTIYLNAQIVENKSNIIYKIDIKKEIDNTTRLYLKNGLEEANKIGAKGVLLHMNTYGGQLDAADSMRTAVLYSPVPVYVFIDNNAASAGALISVAAKKIYMRNGASIGAATVVNQTGAAMPDKYQSYMRSMMRATAEAHGRDTTIETNGDTIYKWVRDPKIAEAMVDDRVVIPNLVDSGKVLTLTANEAEKWGFCDGIAESPKEVIEKYLHMKDYEIKEYAPTFMDELKGFLLNPIFQSILILIMIGGLYFELQSPGIGFPLIAAISAAVLYFAPLYIDGVAANWEILIFLCGLVLIGLEIFVIPGFGVAGISGIILVAGGLIMGLVDNNNFDFGHVSRHSFNVAFLTVVLGIAGGFALSIWLSSRIGMKGPLNKVALHADLEDAVGVPDYSSLVGKEGVTATELRPAGKVFVNNVRYEAQSTMGFIEKDAPVKIVHAENGRIYVEALS